MSYLSVRPTLLFCLYITSIVYAASVDDFEHSGSTNYFNGNVSAYADHDDGGNSEITNGTLVVDSGNIYTLKPVAGQGAAGGTSQNGLLMQFKFGTKKPFDGKYYYGNCVGIRSDLTSNPSGFRDFTGATHIQFAAKASSAMSVRVLVPMVNVLDKGYHRRNVTVDSTWKTFSVSLDTIYQPSWADVVSFDKRLIQRIQWEIITDDNSALKEGSFWIDDIKITNYDSNAPELVSGPEKIFERKPSFQWHTLSGAASYTIQIDTVPTFSSGAIISAAVNDTSFASPVNLSFGNKYWRVKADNSSYSMTVHFVLLDSHIPDLIHVQDSTVERKPTFRWTSANTAVSQFHIQISGRGNFTSITDSATVSDTFFVISKTLGLDSVYYWRVSGDGSAYSKVDSFRVIDGRIPILIDVQSPTGTRRPVLRWHPLRVSAAACTVEVSKSNIMGTIYKAAVTDTFFEVPVDLPLTTIYWRVRGDDSKWASGKSFTILGSSNLDLIHIEPTMKDTIVFCWHKPSIPIQFYKIKIGISQTYWTDSALVMDTFFVWKNRYTSSGTRYWRIIAQDTVSSKVDSFKVLDPKVPWIIPYTPKVSNISKPKFMWHKVAGAASYTIQISDTVSFKDILFSMPTEDTFFQVSVPLEGGTYYWRVKSDLKETYSEIDSLTIQSENIPVLVRYSGTVITDKTPVFAWSKVSGASSYRIILANNPGYSDSFMDTVSDTIFIPQSDLAFGKWYWKVSCNIDYEQYSYTDSLIIDVKTGIRQEHAGALFSIKQNHSGVYVNTRDPLIPGSIKIYNLAGCLVWLPKIVSGSTQFIWNFRGQTGMSMPNGIYIMHLQTTKGVKVHRFSIAR